MKATITVLSVVPVFKSKEEKITSIMILFTSCLAVQIIFRNINHEMLT